MYKFLVAPRFASTLVMPAYLHEVFRGFVCRCQGAPSIHAVGLQLRHGICEPNSTVKLVWLFIAPMQCSPIMSNLLPANLWVGLSGNMLFETSGSVLRAEIDSDWYVMSKLRSW